MRGRSVEENMSGIGFESVIGQKLAVAHLQNALRTNRLSQAYLIHGEKGAGKKALARALAAVLVCEQPADRNGLLEPCGCCPSCRQMKAGTHPDVILVSNERVGAAAKTTTLGVSAARFIQSDAALKPYQSSYKIYVVPNAERMSQQAQNALLKTLEEPPAYVVLLLLADNLAAFLPTILSRCITIQLHPAPEKELVRALEECNVRGARALTLARLSHGNPGRCLALADGEAENFRRDLITFMKKLKESDSHKILLYAQKLAGDKETKDTCMDDFLDIGRSWYRDLLVMKSTQSPENLIFQDEIPYIRSTAVTLSYQGLHQSLEAFDDAQRRRKSRENDVQVAELLLLKLRRVLRSC